MQPEEIKSLRLKLGLTQGAFALKLGVNYQSIGRWERGITKPLPAFEGQLIYLAKKGGTA